MRHTLFLFLLAFAVPVFAQNSVPLSEISELDKNNCINKLNFRREGRMIIKSDEELQNAIRQDGSKERCQAFFSEQNIPFQTHMLVGISIDPGGCLKPHDLKGELQTDYAETKSVLVISYARSRMLCKALYSYSAWYLVPKPVEGFTFEIRMDISAANDDL